MPRGSLNIAMTEAYLPQQHKQYQQQQQQPQQQQPPLREYLLKAEMWYKNPNASRKVSHPFICFSDLSSITRYRLSVTMFTGRSMSFHVHVATPNRDYLKLKPLPNRCTLALFDRLHSAFITDPEPHRQTLPKAAQERNANHTALRHHPPRL